MKFDELLQQHNIPFKRYGEHEHTTRGRISVDCPWCSPGWGHFRCGYNISTKSINCWSCGRLQLSPTIAELLHISGREAYDLSRELDGEARPEAKPRGTLILPDDLGPLQDQHKKYLRSRNFRWRELVRLWEIGGIGMLGGRLAHRIFIPIHFQGVRVSWTTRSISKNHAKRYITAQPHQESIDHRSIVYGYDYCRHACIVVEGPTDVWRIGPGAVATFGTGFTEAQTALLAGFPIRCVCYDGEDSAQSKARELSDLLQPFPGQTYNIVLDCKDPGDASDKDIKLLRKTFLGD